MRLTSRARHAIDAMIDLACRQYHGPVRLADVACRQGVSQSHLEFIFAKLRRGGLVEGVRGAEGLLPPGSLVALRLGDGR